MVIRQRAVQAEDKQERHDAILDAAERLLLRSPDRVANVAEVADEAGLAKGTVYLYFPGKEELLLALHERNVGDFFAALIALLERDVPMSVQDILALTRVHMVESPLFLPLASRCFGLMAQTLPSGAGLAFKQRMADRLERAGAGLEKHNPDMAPGDGRILLRHSYALIIGLWQMSASAGGAGGPLCPLTGTAANSPLAFSFPDDLDRALLTLWRGATVRTPPGSPR